MRSREISTISRAHSNVCAILIRVVNCVDVGDVPSGFLATPRAISEQAAVANYNLAGTQERR